MSDIRSIIRQILIEELDKNEPASHLEKKTESVRIRNSNDLKSFVLRVLNIAKNRNLESDIQSGKINFILESSTGNRKSDDQSQRATDRGSVSINKGLVTEKDIAGLPDNTAIMSVGINACFTPLAKDEIRRRRLKIERKPQ
jgi:hypothetical protein